MPSCCVKGCRKERFPGCGLHFHRIPENPELREKWLKAIPLAGKLFNNSTVCSNHFKSDDYVPMTSSDQKVRSLKQGAIPSILLKVDESNQLDYEEEYLDDELDIDDVAAKNLNKASHFMGATHISSENKTNNVISTPRSEGNKIMVVTPITTVNKIEDLITIKPEISNEQIQLSSKVRTVGTSAMSQVGGLLYNSLTQKQAKNVIVVKPIAENERIEEFISTKSVSNSDDSDDISSIHESSDNNMSSDDEKSMIMPGSEEIYLIEATSERRLKRKYVQETPIDMFGGKVPRNSSLDATETNVTHNSCEKPIKYHVSTQTRLYTSNKELGLKKKIKVLRQKINRRVTAFNQMKTVLDLIKNKCRSYAEVKEVLTLKLKQLPENLNCDGVIIAA